MKDIKWGIVVTAITYFSLLCMCILFFFYHSHIPTCHSVGCMALGERREYTTRLQVNEETASKLADTTNFSSVSFTVIPNITLRSFYVVNCN